MLNVFGGKLKWLEGKTIVFLGDSITADNKSNYVSLFLDNLTESIDVSKLRILNFGVDSSSVLDMFDRSPDVLDECKPDLISIFLGVNDSKIFHHVNKPLISPLVFKESYEMLVDRLAVGGRKKFLLITPPLLMFEEIRSGNYLDDYWYWIPAEYEKYVQAVRDIASDRKLFLADVYDAFKVNKKKNRLFYEDGVHPNIYGHKIIASEIVKSLSQ